tara:strand:+ start:287 stop:1123 length:837 start_codon:yes stop_codon:yes gene_type:complete
MKKLTIGMATYDDYDGVYFTIQALRLYHSEVMDDVEILVVDNNPTSKSGAEVKKFIETSIPNGRYIPFTKYKSNFVKDVVFTEAAGEYVLCIDCHVLIPPGVVEKLISYYSLFPNTKDLLQGPLLHDSFKATSTHFDPEWSGNMFGKWGFAKELFEAGAPFEIPMQGGGLYSCKKEHWVGFNKKLRGFGCEEFYIQEKFRKNGGRALCLPFLQWTHRFGRPEGAKFPLNMEDRIKNYYIAWMELYHDVNHPNIQEMLEYFTEQGHGEMVQKVLEGFQE